MKLRGKNIWIYAGGSAIGLALSCDVEIGLDLVEISNAATGTAKAYTAGRYGWTMSTSNLVDADAVRERALTMALLNRTPVAVFIQDVTTAGAAAGCYKVSGNAYITALTITGEVAGYAKYSAIFTGTGDLTLAEPTETS